MINEMQFKGFRFTVGDEVIVKDKNEKGTILQCKFEIVSNKPNEFILTQKYNVQTTSRYISTKMYEEKDLMYSTDMEPEKEIRVLEELKDMYLLNRQFGMVQEMGRQINKLKGGKGDATQV